MLALPQTVRFAASLLSRTERPEGDADDLKDHLDICRRMCEHAEQRMELDPERGSSRTRLRDAEETAKSLEDDIDAMNTAYLWAGKVIATGGYRQHEDGWPLDWALFAAPEPRQVPNIVSRIINKCLNHILTRDGSGSRPCDRRATKRSLMLRSTGMEHIWPDMPLFKQGRSTGFTAGGIGYIKAGIKSEGGQTVHRT